MPNNKKRRRKKRRTKTVKSEEALHSYDLNLCSSEDNDFDTYNNTQLVSKKRSRHRFGECTSNSQPSHKKIRRYTDAISYDRAM